jgi:hypothetical protein
VPAAGRRSSSLVAGALRYAKAMEDPIDENKRKGSVTKSRWSSWKEKDQRELVLGVELHNGRFICTAPTRRFVRRTNCNL